MIDQINHLVSYNSRLLGFAAQDVERIHEHSELLLSFSDDVVSVVYKRLFEVTETSRVFAEDERPAREQSMREWYHKTVCAEINEDYWLWQWLVGALHLRRGVENPMMVSAMFLVQSVILKKSIEALGIERGEELYLSFCKLSNLVVCLVIRSFECSTYDSIQNATGMTKQLIKTNVSIGLEEQIRKVTNRLRG